jgi:hypothetical protein
LPKGFEEFAFQNDRYSTASFLATVGNLPEGKYLRLLPKALDNDI